MDAQGIGVIGGLLLTAIGMLSAGTWRIYTYAMTKAREEALATARSEALLREAQALADAKNDEIVAIKQVSASELAAVRDQVASYEQANAELRQLLLQCTRRQGGP